MLPAGDEEDIGEKVKRFYTRSDADNAPTALYDAYDYSAFWKGRDFEHLADHIAVSRLITHIPSPHRRLIDVGAGTGRMAPLYETKWESFILLDPSEDQLKTAQQKLSHPEKAEFVIGSAESIPLPDASCDVVLSTRVFHYIADPRRAIREIRRVLVPGGYCILEIPNKRHAKARLKVWYSPDARHELASREPKHVSAKNDRFVFVNHSPEFIRDTLLTEWFTIIETLSVSNFRNETMKKMLPLSWLLSLERILQAPLAKSWFGPSIYFFARKKKETP